MGQKFYTKDPYQYINYAAATTLLLLNVEITITHAEEKPLEVYKGRPRTDCSQSTLAKAFPTSLKKEGNSLRKRLRTKKTKWEVAIKVENKTIQFGTFESQEAATHLYDRAAFIHGQVPNFELPEEEEKEELKHLNWEQFLEITRCEITNKSKSSSLDSLFCPSHIIKRPRTEMTNWEVAIKVENKTDHLGTFESREEAAYLYTRSTSMHGQKPNFELPEEGKQELKHLNCEQFLEITRRGIANKSKSSSLDSLFCSIYSIKRPRTEMPEWEVAIKVENKKDHYYDRIIVWILIITNILSKHFSVVVEVHSAET